MIRRLLLPVSLALTAAALLAGCGSGSSGSPGTTAGGTTAVRVVLDWYANADHVGLIGAVDQGFFREAGLKVSTTVPNDPAAALTQVAAGKAPFAISYEPEVLLARNRGIPVVAVGALVGTPLNSIIARSDRGIRRPRDLEGHTVGAAGVPSDRVLLDTVVRADGGDPAKVRMRNVGFNLSPALAAGRVDAVIGAYWNIEQTDLRAKHVPLSVFRLDRYGVPTYDELVVVTSDHLAATRPGVVRSFLAALAKGQAWAAANPAGAVTALLHANGDLDATSLRDQVRLTAPLLVPAGHHPLWLSAGRWTAFTGWMTANKLLTPSPGTDLSRAVNASFLP
ncbi:MAG: ABC transporter substrate-binding protein [Thermoleophilia bacterium]